jgi:hypothetical protein
MNMYNMDISIGSYKFRLEIFILIVVISWIMFGHLLCSCCTMSLREGLEMAENIADNTIKEVKSDVIMNNKKNKEMGEMEEMEMKEKTNKMSTNLKEGFVGSNNGAYGPEFGASKSPGYIMNPDSWAMPTLTYSRGTAPDAGVKSIWDRPKQPIPLPEGELNMFATTPFKPECCPNAYSSSEGCACMTVDQYNALRTRFGNNVPYSEY